MAARSVVRGVRTLRSRPTRVRQCWRSESMRFSSSFTCTPITVRWSRAECSCEWSARAAAVRVSMPNNAVQCNALASDTSNVYASQYTHTIYIHGESARVTCSALHTPRRASGCRALPAGPCRPRHPAAPPSARGSSTGHSAAVVQYSDVLTFTTSD